jgi:hypothetical protein
MNGTPHIKEAQHQHRWRFSLGALLSLVTILCLSLAVFVLRATEYELKFRCGKMPPNDHALVAWLQRQHDTRHVLVIRNADTVNVRIVKQEFLPTSEGLMPPLDQLGYGEVQTVSMGWTSGWHHVRSNWLSAAAAILLLWLLYVLVRRLARRPVIRPDRTVPENLHELP